MVYRWEKWKEITSPKLHRNLQLSNHRTHTHVGNAMVKWEDDPFTSKSKESLQTIDVKEKQNKPTQQRKREVFQPSTSKKEFQAIKGRGNSLFYTYIPYLWAGLFLFVWVSSAKGKGVDSESAEQALLGAALRERRVVRALFYSMKRLSKIRSTLTIVTKPLSHPGLCILSLSLLLS